MVSTLKNKQTNLAGKVNNKFWHWLRAGNLKEETKGIVWDAKDQALRIKTYTARIGFAVPLQ